MKRRLQGSPSNKHCSLCGLSVMVGRYRSFFFIFMDKFFFRMAGDYRTSGNSFFSRLHCLVRFFLMSLGHLGIRLNYKVTCLALHIVQFAPKSRSSGIIVMNYLIMR